MRYTEDRRINLSVPFLKEGTVLFVGQETERFDKQDLPILFLPDLVSSISPDVRQYFLPGEGQDLSAEEMNQRVRELAGLGDQSGFLYRKDGVLYFHVLTEGTDAVRRFYSSLKQAREPKRNEFRLRKEARQRHFDILLSEEPEVLEEASESIRLSIAGEDEEELDPRVRAILSAWEKIEREFNISIEDLEVLLGYKVKLSRLSISTTGRIHLTDFDNQEVKMDDLTKALYFFYLRHPEGARLKTLHEHEEEILRIYSRLTGRDDPGKIRESVRNLLDPYGNALNVSMSRIKKAFKDVMTDRIARFYYVYGRSGEIRTITLDRDLVIWEH